MPYTIQQANRAAAAGNQPLINDRHLKTRWAGEYIPHFGELVYEKR